MAQIFVFGQIMQDLIPKESQSKQPYVCFDLMEQHISNPPDYYQVWARGEQIARLLRLHVKKGSMIWLAGSLRLVDIRMKDGKTVKKPKVWLNDFGFLPSIKQETDSPQQNPDVIAAFPQPPLEIVDGDRTSLPE